MGQFLRHKPLKSFTSVAAGSTASSIIEQGLMHHVWELEIGDNGATSAGKDLTTQAGIEAWADAMVKQVRVVANSKTQRTFTLSKLNQMNALNGSAFAAKTSGAAGNAAARLFVPILLAEIFRIAEVEVRKGAWNLPKGSPEVKIEVDFQDGVVAPVIGGTVEWEPADTTRGLGAIVKWVMGNIPALGTQNDYDLLKFMGGDFLQSISFWPTEEGVPKYVTELRLNAGQLGDIVDRITYLENQTKLLKRQMQPDTSAAPRYDVVLDYTGPIDDALATAPLTGLQAYFKWNAAAAGNMPYIIQKVGLPD